MQKFILIIFLGLLSCSRNDKVYLCNGPYSIVYHKTNHCQGLRRCTTDIETTDVATAKTNHRRACKYCY
ncbi:MAG: hypothetical protein ABIT81_00015, partial [Ferruginibacter sp.]